jgi:carbon starvation protein CstA
MNNNSNSYQEPIIGDIGQYPIITFLIIVFVVLIILLFKYLKNKPKLYAPIIAIILILVVISFIFKFFHINMKKALMIISFIIIAVVISVLILAQGEYININKIPIVNPITNEEEDEE